MLKQKSDALDKVRVFIAHMRSVLGTVMNAPITNTYIIGTVHCDNAAEFLSHDFKEMLAREGITQTTCPPHVHQLNGVAERAIQGVMELARVSEVPQLTGIGGEIRESEGVSNVNGFGSPHNGIHNFPRSTYLPNNRAMFWVGFMRFHQKTFAVVCVSISKPLREAS